MGPSDIHAPTRCALVPLLAITQTVTVTSSSFVWNLHFITHVDPSTVRVHRFLPDHSETMAIHEDTLHEHFLSEANILHAMKMRLDTTHLQHIMASR